MLGYGQMYELGGRGGGWVSYPGELKVSPSQRKVDTPDLGVCYRKSTVVHVVQVGWGLFSNCKGLPGTLLRHRF